MKKCLIVMLVMVAVNVTAQEIEVVDSIEPLRQPDGQFTR